MFQADRLTAMALLGKYEEMLRLRRIDASGDERSPQAAMRALAKRFPGALREIDELPLPALEERFDAVRAATLGASLPVWACAFAGYHAILRVSIAIKTRAADEQPGRPSRAEIEGAIAIHDLESGDPPRDWLALRAGTIHRPPAGRLHRWALAEVADHFGLDTGTLDRLLFPGLPGRRAEDRSGGTMRAMLLNQLEGHRALTLTEMPEPGAGPGQVVIDVAFAGCNFFDLLISKGQYQTKPDLPFAPGGEVAGLIRSVGEGVTRLNVGDRVLAMLPFGGFASHVVTDEARVFRVPDAMPLDVAAAFPIAYQTSYFGLVDRGRLRAGETLLVHAAAGGVGLAAVQLGVAMGARTYGTAGSPEKLARVEAEGATPINYRDENWHERLKAEVGLVDVVYDPVGGDTFHKSTKCIAFEGRIVVVGFASGKVPPLALNRLLVKNFEVTGIHWGLYIGRKPARVAAAMEALFELYRRGALRPHVSDVRPLEQAPAVLDDLAARKTSGKVVLKI